MEQITLPKDIIDCLQGWCIKESALTNEERALLLDVADFKRTRYAIVPKSKIEGLQKLGLMFIETTPTDPDQPYCLFKNGVWVNLSITQDFLEDHVIMVYFTDKDNPAANKAWNKYFKRDEFQSLYNGLVALTCRAISFRKPETDHIYLKHLQIANLIANG